MDSRVVAREIKNEIWPLLRKHGFTQFSLKTAWRHLSEQIHVVNFQSFNSSLADRVGCTTFSFALNLGIYVRAIPVLYPVRHRRDPSVTPQEFDCHFRRRLLKEIEQLVLPRRDIWYVAGDGSNLLACMTDARVVLQGEGLPWFEKFQSLEDVLHLLMGEGQLPDVYAAPHSPARKYMIGHIAHSLGHTEIAEPMIAEANCELEAIKSQMMSFGRKRNQ
jgi:hypothetical protein